MGARRAPGCAKQQVLTAFDRRAAAAMGLPPQAPSCHAIHRFHIPVLARCTGACGPRRPSTRPRLCCSSGGAPAPAAPCRHGSPQDGRRGQPVHGEPQACPHRRRRAAEAGQGGRRLGGQGVERDQGRHIRAGVGCLGACGREGRSARRCSILHTQSAALRQRTAANASPRPALQCFDITDLSETRPGAHRPLAVTPQELPRWSKASGQFKCAAAGAGACVRLDPSCCTPCPAARCQPTLPASSSQTPNTPRYPSPKPAPSSFLRKGEGEAIKAQGPAPPPARSPSPPRAGAKALRDNPPNTSFRRFYERGDLPIAVDHKSFKNAVSVGGSGALGECSAHTLKAINVSKCSSHQATECNVHSSFATLLLPLRSSGRLTWTSWTIITTCRCSSTASARSRWVLRARATSCVARSRHPLLHAARNPDRLCKALLQRPAPPLHTPRTPTVSWRSRALRTCWRRAAQRCCQSSRRCVGAGARRACWGHTALGALSSPARGFLR